MKKFAFLILLGVALLTSCKTPTNITYLQDVNENVPIKTQGDGYIRFMPGDKLSIFVHSRDEKLMDLFNLSGRNGGSNMMMAGGQNYAPYTVDDNGEIEFPVLGAVKIGGLTRNEVEKKIMNELIKQSLCKDPIVTVAFYNMNFSVLGSAGTGVKQINKDRITLLEAIAMGELDINGLRKNVLVMRQEGDQQVPYRVDLTSAESIYNSPVYFIRQNDIIYVEPNNMAKRGSTVMGSSAYQPAFWFSMITSIASVGALIWALFK
ncbi:MAG: polysaccharide biosynthesis/export family protein [Prevotella sp.]|nr:polysaccharide biosynthesis/export family protein [Prevotella sp.]